ncbi:predicted protein [Chaetoceros tenuissimus]|uniref:Uncharacterized protein n=1 Tax=Chaetoceros tenuissimus TaxID=426638 RepID=A0AAD3D2A5_9STRA|nr:predicted protein [Chaetoceros tenuissimus]
MMFNKSTALLSALLVTTSVTAADLRTKSTNEDIRNVIHSKDDIGAMLKNIPMNAIRKLNSETCESETANLYMNQGVQDALAVDISDYTTSSYCSGSSTKVSCDYKDAYSGLEAACESAGGQLFQYSVTMKGQGISVSYKNMADCIGASCDKDAALDIQEEFFSMFTAFGFEVTVKESGASNASAAAVAMIALTGVVATLI